MLRGSHGYIVYTQRSTRGTQGHSHQGRNHRWEGRVRHDKKCG